MDLAKLKKNYYSAVSAQGISMLVSAVTTLLLPKFLGVEQFGYWQLFIFYINFTGVAHLGLNDGIYLRNGGTERASIGKSSIHSQFLIGLFCQSIIAAIIVAMSFFLVESTDRLFVLIMTSLFLLINNSAQYFGYLFQAMNETRLYSFSIALDRAFFLLFLLILLFVGAAGYQLYVIYYVLAKSICLIYCLFKARDILKSKPLVLKKAINETAHSVSIGIKLMIATLSGMLIIGMLRFFIDTKWGIEVFSEVSFALTMMSFFMMFMTQAGMVLFPALSQADKAKRITLYERLRSRLSFILTFSYVLYFPIVAILTKWIPDYLNSMYYFALILPICVFDGKMSAVYTTYYKVERRESRLLTLNLLSLFGSSILVIICIYTIDSLDLSLIAVVLIIILRSCFAEYDMARDLKNADVALTLSEIIMTCMFIILILTQPFYSALFIMVIVYIVKVAVIKLLDKRLIIS